MKVFLDSSVIIIGFILENSNSAKVLDLLFEKRIEAVISERVLNEVKRYFREKKSRNFAFLIELLLRKNCNVVYNEEVKEMIMKLSGKIKEKDIEQLAVVRKLNLKYLVGYDRDFKQIEEYITPKGFIEKFGIEPFETEY